MKKIGILCLFLAVMAIQPKAFADSDNTNIKTGKITVKSSCACALSFLIWPGIGQAVNNTPSDKVVTHAVAGLVPLYRFWSGYDALVDRKGGYWKGRI